MIRALFFKELREIAGWTIGALALQLMIVAFLTGINSFPMVMASERTTIPFQNGDLAGVQLIGFIFALLVALQQTCWEAGRDSYLFLLHRPVPRRAVFGTKLIVGIMMFAICVGVPIGIFACWAAGTGHHASPFRWSMTTETWVTAVVLVLPYLGMFLSGIRPGQWFGTRLLPLFGSGLLVFVVLFWWSGDRPLWASVVGVLGAAAMVACILHTAKARDY